MRYICYIWELMNLWLSFQFRYPEKNLEAHETLAHIIKRQTRALNPGSPIQARL